MSTPVHQIRIYFDTGSGDIVHVHQLVGEPLPDERIAQEMGVVEASLRERHANGLDYLVVDDEALAQAMSPDVSLRVDLSSRTLVRS
jgi:hypothetical protein